MKVRTLFKKFAPVAWPRSGRVYDVDDSKSVCYHSGIFMYVSERDRASERERGRGCWGIAGFVVRKRYYL